jgi:hypothetical protein
MVRGEKLGYALIQREKLQEWAGSHRWKKCNTIGCSIRCVTDQNRDLKPIGWLHLLLALLLLLIKHPLALQHRTPDDRKLSGIFLILWRYSKFWSLNWASFTSVILTDCRSPRSSDLLGQSAVVILVLTSHRRDRLVQQNRVFGDFASRPGQWLSPSFYSFIQSFLTNGRTVPLNTLRMLHLPRFWIPCTVSLKYSYLCSWQCCMLYKITIQFNSVHFFVLPCWLNSNRR